MVAIQHTPNPQKVMYHRQDPNCIFPEKINHMKNENKAVQLERGKRNIWLVTISVQKDEHVGMLCR